MPMIILSFTGATVVDDVGLEVVAVDDSLVQPGKSAIMNTKQIIMGIANLIVLFHIYIVRTPPVYSENAYLW